MVRRVLVAAVLSLLVFEAACFVASTAALIRWPWELDYGEGVVWWQAERVFRPAEAYHPFEEFPHVVFNYGPVFHVLTRIAALPGGDLLSAGRSVAWLSALGVAGLAAWIVGAGTAGARPRRLVVAGVTACLVLQLPTFGWVPGMRVDMTGLLFSLGGLALFVGGSSGRVRALALLAFALGLFTKQTMIAAPLATLATLVVAGQMGAALRLGAGLAALGAFGVAALAALTHGEFVVHAFGHNQNPFDPAQMIWLVTENVERMAPLGILALALPLARLSGAVEKGRLRWPLSGAAGSRTERALVVTCLHLGLAFVVSLTVGKVGAWKNYFLEWNVACCILAGLSVGHLLDARARWRPGVAAMAGLLVLGVATVRSLPAALGQASRALGRDAILADRAAGGEAALAVIRAAPGLVYSEDMVLLMRAGRPIPWEPAIVTQLAVSGAFDEGPLLESVRGHELELLVVRDLANTHRYTSEMRAAIESAYVPIRELPAGYRILAPRAERAALGTPSADPASSPQAEDLR